MTAPVAPVDYQRLFRALPENLLLMAPDATILDNTDSHVAVSLKPRAEVVGKSLFEAFPSVDQNEGDVIFQSHEHVRRFREPHVMPLIRYDLAVPAEQGGGFEEMYWQATHYPVLDEAGALQYIVQRTQNVTEQHRAARRAAQVQTALDESQNRTRFILENLPLLVWTTRPDGWADTFNARWTDFTGRPLADTVGWGWTDDLHPDDVATTRELWQAARDQNRAYQAEYRMRRHDGQYRWHLAQGVPRLGPDGRILMWVGCNVDIHEQKLMVQELLQAAEQQALLSEQAYQNFQQAQQQRTALYNLFMQAPAQIAVVRGPEFRYEFANPHYLAALGNRALLGRPVAEAVPEIANQGLLPVLEEVYRTGVSFQAREVRHEFDADGSGQLRAAYYTYVIQRFEENGQPAGLSSYAYDVTELVQARQALEQLRDTPAPASDEAPAA